MIGFWNFRMLKCVTPNYRWFWMELQIGHQLLKNLLIYFKITVAHSQLMVTVMS